MTYKEKEDRIKQILSNWKGSGYSIGTNGHIHDDYGPMSCHNGMSFDEFLDLYDR